MDLWPSYKSCEVNLVRKELAIISLKKQQLVKSSNYFQLMLNIAKWLINQFDQKSFFPIAKKKKKKKTTKI